MIQIRDLSHVTIIVKDAEASRRFYSDVLGMDEVPRPGTFTHSVTWYRKGSAEIHLIQQDDAAQEPGDGPTHIAGDRDLGRARHLAFQIDDEHEAVRWLGERGIPVVLGPRPRGDGAIQLYVHDPDGHLVELHTPATEV